MDTVKPLPKAPMVRVLDEDGKEVLRGWYCELPLRTPCPGFDPPLREEDIAHCILVPMPGDWNMPYTASIKRVTLPHTIEIIEDGA